MQKVLAKNRFLGYTLGMNNITIRELLEQARLSSAKFAAKPKAAFKPLIKKPQAGGSYRIAPTESAIEFFKHFPA